MTEPKPMTVADRIARRRLWIYTQYGSNPYRTADVLAAIKHYTQQWLPNTHTELAAKKFSLDPVDRTKEPETIQLVGTVVPCDEKGIEVEAAALPLNVVVAHFKEKADAAKTEVPK